MKFLLDQGLPKGTINHLSEGGIESLHVFDCGLSNASDGIILEAAREQNWTIVTLDADFHAILAVAGATAPSVVRIRVEGLKGEQLAKLLAQVILQHGAALEEGAVPSIGPNRTAVHHLPILGRK